MPANTRHRVMSLYKELHRLGRDYPDPAYVLLVSMWRNFWQDAIDTTSMGVWDGCSRVCGIIPKIEKSLAHVASMFQKTRTWRIRRTSRGQSSWGNISRMVRGSPYLAKESVLTSFDDFSRIGLGGQRRSRCILFASTGRWRGCTQRITTWRWRLL